MVLKLHGAIYAIATQRVVLVLKALDVPFELVPVDLTKGEHKSGEYMAKQPFGLVPFMDDDGLRLYESRAICRYIVAKYGHAETCLIPRETNALALFEQAASVETAHFDPPALTIYYETLLAKYYGRPEDKAGYQQAVKKIETTLDVYETILGNQKYLAGDHITLVDFFHVPLGKALHLIAPSIIDTRFNVARWWKDVSTLPACHAVTKVVREGCLPILCDGWVLLDARSE